MLKHSSKYFLWRSTEERNSYRFATARGSKWWQKLNFCMNHPFKNKKWQTSPSRKYYLHHHQSHRHAIKAESRPSAAGSHEDPEGYVTGAVISDECWSVCVSRDVRSAASQQAWHNSIKVPQKQRKKSVISIYIREGSNFPLWRADRATFYTPWGKQMKPVIIIYGLFGGVSECGARSYLTVRYVWLNLSLTDAIFISRETVTSHLTTGTKIKHFFGGENLFLWVYCHRLLKAALQLTCWEEYCAFSSE